MSERKIIICHVAEHITALADGRFNHLKMIFDNLDQEKYVHILIYEGGEEVKSKLNYSNVKVFDLKCLGKKIPIKSFIQLYRIIKKENVDILQSHSTKAYILLGIISIISGIVHIYNYHGIFIKNIYYNKLEKFILYSLHIIIYLLFGCRIAIAPSKHSLQILLKESKYFRDKAYYFNSIVKKNENIIDPEILNQIKTLHSNYFLIGIISRVEIQKRIDLAIKVLKFLLQKGLNDIYFVVVGDGILLDSMKELANNLKVNHRIKFLGYVNRVDKLLEYFDLILFTSEWEGFPLTIWEAMSEGVPIVSSDVGGIKEIVEKVNCGYVYPFGDLETCASLIIKLKNNPELRMKLGLNGKKAMETTFTKEKFINFFNDLYNSLVLK